MCASARSSAPSAKPSASSTSGRRSPNKRNLNRCRGGTAVAACNHSDDVVADSKRDGHRPIVGAGKSAELPLRRDFPFAASAVGPEDGGIRVGRGACDSYRLGGGGVGSRMGRFRMRGGRDGKPRRHGGIAATIGAEASEHEVETAALLFRSAAAHESYDDDGQDSFSAHAAAVG